MAQRRESIDVLAVMPDGAVRDRISGQGVKNNFLFLQESTLELGNARLNREGYRFRIVLVDMGVADGVTDWIVDVSRRFPWIAFALYAASGQMAKKKASKADFAKAAKNLMVESTANTLVRILGGGGPDAIAKAALGLLEDSRASLDSLPSPPYGAGKTSFLKEAGPLLFSVCLTERPWALECDVFTLPVNRGGGMGAVGIAWLKELSRKQVAELEATIISVLPQTGLDPINPEHATFGVPIDGEIQSRNLILATADREPGATVLSAVDACIAAIALAASLEDCRTLVLPVIGGGAAGQPISAIVRGVLEEFDPKMELGALRHVIFTVNRPENLEELTAVDRDAIARVQKLENDVPSGTDRLQVQSEVDALADAIALRDMRPPLVVGVLGGWGTGKSFVLHLLKERLRTLRKWDLSDEEVRNRFPFVGHPYLVHFDAWTYAKSDLWASLMQRILLDLDKQLSLEQTLQKAKPDLLTSGVDIWELLDDLTPEQIRVLEQDLGEDAIREFENWKRGEAIAPSLWNKLTELRQLELTKLENAESEFDHQQLRYGQVIDRLEKALKRRIDRQRRSRQQQLAEQEENDRSELAGLIVKRDRAVRNATERINRKFDGQARKEAFGLARSQLKLLLGNSVDKALQGIADTEGTEIPSVSDAVGKLSDFKKSLLGIRRSKRAPWILFVLLATVVLTILAEHSEWLTIPEDSVIYSLLAAASGGLATFLSAVSKVNGVIADTQKKFEDDIEASRQKHESQRKAALDQAVRSDVVQTEQSITEIEDRLAAQARDWNAMTESQLVALEQRGHRRLERLKSNRDKTLDRLEADVRWHKRRAGLTGRGRSLLDIVGDRAKSGYYEDKLGVLHQIQQDLMEITAALVPVEGHDTTLFPRGEPRIILVVDDLDRCPPDRVVQMLEAAQLLVKTRLFVVVLAMDVRYITRALEKQYKEILVRDGEPSGLDYIEKIVQVPYRVPGIAPGVMRSFLHGQMNVVGTGTQRPGSKLPGGLQPDEEPAPPPPAADSATPVFFSNYDPKAETQTDPLPTKVQQFDETELALLTECCNATRVSPRAGRRIVNVFKLLKIIWFHRGLHREPAHDVKRAMLFLLALSATQPVVMRQVLQYLEDEYREAGPDQPLKDVLLASLDRPSLRDVRHGIREMVKDLITSKSAIPDDLPLRKVELDNIRLVKSFSFVGEVDSAQRSRRQAGAAPTAGNGQQPTDGASQPGGQGNGSQQPPAEEEMLDSPA